MCWNVLICVTDPAHWHDMAQQDLRDALYQSVNTNIAKIVDPNQSVNVLKCVNMC